MSGSKASRLLCLLLSSLLVLGCFSVGASAADEASGNLVEPDLLTWSTDKYTTLSYFNGVGRLYVQAFNSAGDGEVLTQFYGAYDIPELIVGHNYTASVHFPSLSEINSALGTSLSDNDILKYLNNSNLSVCFGIAYKAPNKMIRVEEFSWSCPGTEFNEYFGQTVSFDFDYETRSDIGSAVFVIALRLPTNVSSTHFLYFSNPVLKDNDADNSEGLLSRLLEFLVKQFAFIGTNIDDMDTSIGHKLSSLLSGLSDKLAEVKHGIADKLGEVKNGISDSIFQAFDDLGIDLQGWFNNVGSWFTDLKNKLTENIEAFKSAITDFFDKFKPRVYEELYWERGMINGSNGSVINQIINQNVIVSELFEVPLGTQYNFDFIDSDLNGAFQIYQYSMDGSFIGSYALFSTSVEEHILPQGYSYRFRLVLDRTTHPSAANNIVKIYADEGWLNAMIRLLIYKIRGLFVPDPYFIADWSEEMDTFLSTHFGIIYDAGTFTSDFISKIADLLSNNEGEIDFKLPAIKFKLNDMDIVLWEEKHVDMSFLTENGFFAMFYGLYNMILWVIFIFATIKHATKTFERILQV